MPNPVTDRELHRRIVVECGALVDLLNDLYPASDLPPPAATEGELRAWMAERRLVARLNHLRKEASSAPAGSLPSVLHRGG